MKKMIMFSMMFSFAFIFLFLPKVEVEASERENNDLNVINEEEALEVFEFDLSDDGAQEIKFVNDDGENVVMGIGPAEADENVVISPFLTYPISEGKYTRKIYYYTGAINISYRLHTSRLGKSAVITGADQLSVNLLGYTESNRNFGYNSKKAEYSGSAVLFNFAGSFSIRLTSEISGTNLVVTGRG